MRCAVALALLGVGIAGTAGPARAFGIFPSQAGRSREGGLRWDSAPRTIYGAERSLDGGLRYSLQGGSYEAYRDTFLWQNQPPSAAAFQAAVERSFAQWVVTDPATGLGTNLAFVPDLATPVSFTYGGGAEIDFFSTNDSQSWNPGQDTPVWGEVFRDQAPTYNDITLTSGTTGYSGVAIAGADVFMNSNVRWSLVQFEVTLTHEIGHALGLEDVDRVSGPNGFFIDDNYDGTSSDTARATLTNSFAALIDPYDPASSPLDLYYVSGGDPGIDSDGVFILMESYFEFSLWFDPTKLQNDDFAGRQFLYPFVVPEPASLPLVALGLAALAGIRRRLQG